MFRNIVSEVFTHLSSNFANEYQSVDIV